MKRLATLASCALLSSCSWTNPDNRPVWNAFEQHLVPENDAWFAVSLPLTAPAGLLAVIADTLIVHPAQVVDDAARDASELWTDLGSDWDNRYYTGMAGVPFRAAATPPWFLCSFLGRSMFDIPSDAAAKVDEVSERPEIDAAALMLSWLDRLAAGADDAYEGPPLKEWTTQLTAALRRALDHANADGRLRLYAFAVRGHPPADVLAPTAGLRDADPVVRYRQLSALPADVEVDVELEQALMTDPVESIRLLAARRFVKPDDESERDRED